MNARLAAWGKSAGVWLNAALLVAVQYTDEIVKGINDNMPALAQYLPPNIYKGVGIAVVVFNLARSARRSHLKAQAKEAANG